MSKKPIWCDECAHFYANLKGATEYLCEFRRRVRIHMPKSHPETFGHRAARACSDFELSRDFERKHI